MEKHFNSYYFFYFKKSETSVEKESTSTIEDNNEEQDTYVLTLSQKVKEENQSDPISKEEIKHQTLFEECSQVKFYYILLCIILLYYMYNIKLMQFNINYYY